MTQGHTADTPGQHSAPTRHTRPPLQETSIANPKEYKDGVEAEIRIFGKDLSVNSIFII